ncbi:NadR type nicotinamide-nucleotide adenylyltransferase [Lentzea atacamensis]|uniref:NadR type nicotinamide-nucleotide adenylyltransferase n=1 Tax=Lentzea atacamensis TaxID=531938 RepID=A0A316HZQ6_9PSEU|nr:AAA family ATPase [Lentzea atacamensis]PWK86176.1 NadR type nicotinamide-nucleotide adenylyltransferase [Lentzea atacamensis]
MKEFGHALVLGKFYPPHNGHHHLIETAAARSERTTVTVLAASAEKIPLEHRVRWLTETHATTPGVRIIGDLDDHPMDFDSDEVWSLHTELTKAVLARRAIADGEPGKAGVDVVFSSEKYGDELARRLGAQHVLVDLDRVTHPVSGTAVRTDPVANWHHLAPATQRGLGWKVVVVGAESTGTTTLSTQLANHFGAPWIPEYGREHTEHKLAAARAFDTNATVDGLVWTLGDFEDVAREQERRIQSKTAPLVIADNDAFAATVWGERYLGFRPNLFLGTAPDLYLLTDHAGVPFEQDGWRDGEHLREWMTGLFERELTARGVPWLKLTEDRFATAVTAVEHLMRQDVTRGSRSRA